MQKKSLITVILTLSIIVLTSATTLAASILVKEGMRGHAVRHVQELLIAEGYLDGEADGVCGKMTRAAIERFQAANGLEVDGVCGSATYRVLSKGKSYEPPPYKAGDGKTYHGTPMWVHATAYSAHDPGNSHRTATGTRVRRGVIAVDPSVIPMGTRVYIPGYGEAVAEDKGSAIRGAKIDIAFDTHEEAIRFGRQDIEIIILD